MMSISFGHEKVSRKRFIRTNLSTSITVYVFLSYLTTTLRLGNGDPGLRKLGEDGKIV